MNHDPGKERKKKTNVNTPMFIFVWGAQDHIIFHTKDHMVIY